MKTVRHPPSRELWRFCMDRLRDLRGPDTRERELANVLGFEHSRAVRWKEGQMYVDRAEYLLRLADALEVEPMLLVGMAAGGLSVAEAQRQVARAGKGADDGGKKRPARATGAEAEPARIEGGGRGVVLLISAAGAGEKELREAVDHHADIALIASASFAAGLTLAERYRPELAFLDLGEANVHAFEACRVLSSLTTRAQRKCRVVAGTSTFSDEIEKPALMAGAASMVLLPWQGDAFESELDRLEERLGARKAAKK